jgi:hypothetical protein
LISFVPWERRLRDDDQEVVIAVRFGVAACPGAEQENPLGPKAPSSFDRSLDAEVMLVGAVMFDVPVSSVYRPARGWHESRRMRWCYARRLDRDR